MGKAMAVAVPVGSALFISLFSDQAELVLLVPALGGVLPVVEVVQHARSTHAVPDAPTDSLLWPAVRVLRQLVP